MYDLNVLKLNKKLLFINTLGSTHCPDTMIWARCPMIIVINHTGICIRIFALYLSAKISVIALFVILCGATILTTPLMFGLEIINSTALNRSSIAIYENACFPEPIVAATPTFIGRTSCFIAPPSGAITTPRRITTVRISSFALYASRSQDCETLDKKSSL